MERASGIEPLTSAWKAKGHPVKPARLVAAARSPLLTREIRKDAPLRDDEAATSDLPSTKTGARQ